MRVYQLSIDVYYLGGIIKNFALQEACNFASVLPIVAFILGTEDSDQIKHLLAEAINTDIVFNFNKDRRSRYFVRSCTPITVSLWDINIAWGLSWKEKRIIYRITATTTLDFTAKAD